MVPLINRTIILRNLEDCFNFKIDLIKKKGFVDATAIVIVEFKSNNKPKYKIKFDVFLEFVYSEERKKERKFELSKAELEIFFYRLEAVIKNYFVGLKLISFKRTKKYINKAESIFYWNVLIGNKIFPINYLKGKEIFFIIENFSYVERVKEKWWN